MLRRFLFLYHRFREQLWAKPVAICGLSVACVFLAKAADQFRFASVAPDVTLESVETLLKVIAASMLVMAIFAVGSMVSAYASASSNATPRAFPLVIADDVSQNALTAFIGAFIFSIVALFALQNGFYDQAGRFALLLLTFLVFAVVILTFVWWVDRIARLGRLGATIEKVESATAAALRRRRRAPRLGGSRVGSRDGASVPIFGKAIGYVQHVKVPALQAIAEEFETQIEVTALPGTFASPARPLAYVTANALDLSDVGPKISSTFVIGGNRTFEDDPRFGLVVLSEIASRALSPGINDSGSAIGVIGSLVRLLVLWSQPDAEDESVPIEFDRVAIPALSLEDMFDDAFTMIARDGAGAVEVALRLQKAFEALASVANTETLEVSLHYARMSVARAEKALELPEDLEAVKNAGQFAIMD
tara:strand:- start:3161 stop:4420 length:1260 start_codon:yes stop_codon:yes gene_type:complete